MDFQLYKYLQTEFSQHPKTVDKLIVSSFLKKNKLRVKKNKFLLDYIISETNKQDAKNLNDFIVVLNKHYPSLTIESLIELFEYVISPSDRIITGAVYTPSFIREYIVSSIFNSTKEIKNNWRASDLACGCGGFLYTIAKYLKMNTSFTYQQIFRNNIFGLDIKGYSITRTKILLSIIALTEGEDVEEFHFNLFTGNALDFKWSQHISEFTGFNCIVGNPPYVCSRKIEPKTKRFLSKYEVCATGHPDLYIPFFEIGLEMLLPNGFLGFITMNSFFKSLNGRALRDYFEKKQYLFTILDFGPLQVFRKKTTFTCICIIQNKVSTTIDYTRLSSLDSLTNKNIQFLQIPYQNLKSHSGWNLLNSDLIHRIESIGTPFSKRFTTRTGIATLKNEIFIFEPVDQDDDYYYLQNGSLYPIEKTICKEIVNPNKLTNLANLSFTEKFIFPYEFINGKASVFTEKVLQERYPCAHRYLKSKRKVLETRDKGTGDYSKWFAFGRTQSLELMKYKLFFPHITSRIPNFIINTDENLFFYNGLAVIGKNEEELVFLSKLMSSRLFWFYLQNTSKPYKSGFISMSRNYIKDFGIYDFTRDDVSYVLAQDDNEKVNTFFEEKYHVILRNVKNDQKLTTSFPW